MDKLLKSLCFILGLICIVSVSQLISAWQENGRLGAAYSSVLTEEQSLRTSYGEAQAREAAANEKIDELQHELTQTQNELARARDALSKSSSVSGLAVGDTPPDSSGNQTQTYTITDKSGNTFTLSFADYMRLHPRGLKLDEEKRVLDQRNVQLTQFFDSIEEARKTIDNTDQSQVDQFNARLDSTNAAKAKYNQDVDLYNSEVNDFNTELERVGTKVVSPVRAQ